MDSEILVLAVADRIHPKYGPYDLTAFVPPPDRLFARIGQLQEHGDPEGELPLCLRQIDRMARLVCRDSAILFAITSERADMPDDVRRLVDLCLPPAETPDEAFSIWLAIARRGAQMELEAVTKANLQPDVKSVLADLIQRRLQVVQQETNDLGEQAMQVVAFWWMFEELGKVASVALDAVGLNTAPQEAKERAHALYPLGADYIIALSEVPNLSLAKFGQGFRRAFAKQRRLNLNPSGTGKNPQYEHEVAESCLELPEDTPSPLEIAPSTEPDPAEVVADKDLLERTLARFGKRTAEILRLMATEGMTIAEAARVLGMSESTARTLLERARKQFSKNP